MRRKLSRLGEYPFPGLRGHGNPLKPFKEGRRRIEQTDKKRTTKLKFSNLLPSRKACRILIPVYLYTRKGPFSIEFR